MLDAIVADRSEALVGTRYTRAELHEEANRLRFFADDDSTAAKRFRAKVAV
jgi:hypothetical protein